MQNKVAIHTTALGPIASGGIRCIVKMLNGLINKDYICKAFVDIPPFDSTWLPSKFEVLPSNSKEHDEWNGILISPYTPTARRVSEHKNASHRIYWTHTFEPAFKHAGKAFTDEAVRSYRLKNIHYMATSHYVKTFLELIFDQYVLPYLVPGGVDHKIFYTDESIEFERDKFKKVSFCMLNRSESLRGIDIGLEAFELLKKDYGDLVEMKLFGGIPQDEMYKAYGSSHFFVDPSLLAGLPLPPLEAMACGCVPITTHFGTTDYLIDGKNGFFINANDIQDTYRVMKYCAGLFIEQTASSYRMVEHGMHSSIMYYFKLVENAHTTATKWTWKQMIDNFEKNLLILEGK
jgi:glycosyltransferase involved in cell wall biosynthesis